LLRSLFVEELALMLWFLSRSSSGEIFLFIQRTSMILMQLR
jgi:hypothetical protein